MEFRVSGSGFWGLGFRVRLSFGLFLGFRGLGSVVVVFFFKGGLGFRVWALRGLGYQDSRCERSLASLFS